LSDAKSRRLERRAAVSLVLSAMRMCCSPDLSDRHSDGLRIRLAYRFGDHSLIVENEITPGPEPQAYSHAESERVGGAVLDDAVDTGLASTL
jgi:hypothetical protein